MTVFLEEKSALKTLIKPRGRIKSLGGRVVVVVVVLAFKILKFSKEIISRVLLIRMLLKHTLQI